MTHTTVKRLPWAQFAPVLRRYLSPQRSAVLMMSLMLLVSIALQLVAPQAIRHFIDAVQRGSTEQELLVTAAIYLVLSLLQQAMRIGAGYWVESVAWMATNALRVDLAEHVLRLDVHFHQTHAPGELIERVDGDVNALAGFFSDFVLQLLGSLVLLIGIITALAFINIWVGVAMTIFVLAVLGVLSLVWRRGVAVWEGDREHNGAFFGFLGEVMSAIEDLRANDGTAYVFRRFFAQLQHWLPVRLRADFWGQSVMVASIFAAVVCIALAYGLGGSMYFKGALTLGQVYAIIAYATMLDGPIETLRAQLQQLQQASAALNRIQNLSEMQSAIQDGHLDGSAEPDQMHAAALSLRFSNVRFCYEDAGDQVGDQAGGDTQELKTKQATWTLGDLSFTLPKGRILGVIGHTGSGKTTLARLIFRQYDPLAGEIFLGDTNLRHFTLDALRSQIAWVTQDVQLLHATLRDNLTFFRNDVSDTQLTAVLHQLGLNRWLTRLPNGLDTFINPSELSAGEAQSLALARSFIRNPRLVILDEASSRLDPETQRVVDHALAMLLAGRTTIIIAHRLDTLDRVDDILMLENGKMVEFGSREALLTNRDSSYFRLRHTYGTVFKSTAQPILEMEMA